MFSPHRSFAICCKRFLFVSTCSNVAARNFKGHHVNPITSSAVLDVDEECVDAFEEVVVSFVVAPAVVVECPCC